MSTPFNPALIIERLKAAVTAAKLVGNAANYAAVKGLRDFPVPSVFVLRPRESGDPHGAGRQRANVVIGIAIVGRNYRDGAGAAATDDLDLLIKQVRDALIGWQPPVKGGRPIQWAQGDLLDYDDSTAVWMEVFQTQHFIGPGQ